MASYKPHGSISNAQLMPQRHHNDTFFGEQVLANSQTGQNTADNIRYDILEGITASIRNYTKKGRDRGFVSSYNFKKNVLTSEVMARIEAETGRHVDSIVMGSWDFVAPEDKFHGTLSRDNAFYLENAKFAGVDCIGGINYSDGTLKGIVSMVNAISFDDEVWIRFNLHDNTTISFSYDNTVPLPENNKEAYYAEYMVGSKLYYYYSEDRFYGGGSTTLHKSVTPIIPFQDNWNNEMPYETRPWDEPLFKDKEYVLNKLGVDFTEMSRQIFPYIPPYNGAGGGLKPDREWNLGYGNQWRKTQRLRNKYATEQEYYNFLKKEIEIPPFGSRDWNSDYGSTYKQMKKTCKKGRNVLKETQKFCDKYSTEKAYYDDMVDDKKEADKNIKNITDAHFGFFASAKNLKESNVVALFYTLLPILKLMFKSDGSLDPLSMWNQHLYEDDGTGCISDKDSGGCGQVENMIYKFGIKQGSFEADYAFTDWSVCRRYGIADPIFYPPGVKSPKYKHPGFDIVADNRGTMKAWNDGPQRDSSYSEERAPDDTPGSTMIELRVQDRPDSSGRPRYLEMRLYTPTARHKVNVIRDGKYGKSGEVQINGGLDRFYHEYNEDDDEDIPYSDVLTYPLSYEAIREVPIFKRERLMREALIIRVSAIQMEKIHWYQKGWFKILMMIAALVLTYFTGGGALAVIKAMAVMAVMQMISTFINNPFLQALLQIVAMFYIGYLNTGAFSINPAMLVEATGVVMQAQIAAEMQKLQDEIDELRKEMAEKMEEFKKMQEEVGNDDFNKDYMLYVTKLAPVEDHETWAKRTLNSELPSNKVVLPNSELKLRAPHSRDLN